MSLPCKARALGAALLLLLASAPASRADEAATARPSFWFAGGIGAAQMESNSAAPVSSGRTGFAYTLSAGWRFAPALGLGLEAGSNVVESFFRCDYGPCYASQTDLARGKEFDHFLVVLEGRPHPSSGWLLSAGAGALQYCHGQNVSTICQTLTAPGLALAAGYDWRITRGARLGLRLAVEHASFPAKPAAGIASFEYSAARLTLQLTTL